MNKEDDKPDIYLITIESFRADRFGTDLTPNLNRLAQHSIVFNNFYCAGAPTPFALSTIIGGTYPFEHRDGYGLSPTVPTLPEVLQHNDYHTCTSQLAGWYSEIYGYSRGFNVWGKYKYSKLKSLKLLFSYLIRQKLSIEDFDEIIGNIRKADTEKPLFYWYHLERTHQPYWPDYSEFREIGGKLKGKMRFIYEILKNEWFWYKFRRRLASTQKRLSFHKMLPNNVHSLECMYNAQLKTVDRYLSTFLSDLQEISKLRNRNYVIIITADHGEEFLERGSVAHSDNSHDDVVARIPLIIFESWNEKQVIREDLLSTLYIPQAILGYADIAVPKEWNTPQVIFNGNRYVIQEGEAPFGPFNLPVSRQQNTQDRYIKIRIGNKLSYTRFLKSGIVIIEEEKSNVNTHYQDFQAIFSDHIRRQAQNRLKSKAHKLMRLHK